MENSEIRKRIINLGKMLVKELGLDPGVDTLSRWMSHYVAEQMTNAENTVGEEKIKAEQQCFETILKLWQHRSSFQKGRRPFENFESIFRMLERIDPENKQPFLFNNRDEEAEDSGKKAKISENVQKWLNIATGIDQAVRVWLTYVFEQAVSCATDETTIEWLKNSITMGDHNDVAIIVRMLPIEHLESEEIALKSIKQKEIELLNERIKKLELFNNFNQDLVSILRTKLAELTKDDSL